MDWIIRVIRVIRSFTFPIMKCMESTTWQFQSKGLLPLGLPGSCLIWLICFITPFTKELTTDLFFGFWYFLRRVEGSNLRLWASLRWLELLMWLCAVHFEPYNNLSIRVKLLGSYCVYFTATYSRIAKVGLPTCYSFLLVFNFNESWIYFLTSPNSLVRTLLAVDIGKQQNILNLTPMCLT